MPLIISIEGNIGSGKTTLVNYLKENWDSENRRLITYLQEPVDIWTTIQDENSESILSKFYKNQDKYAFSFQMMAYISRISLLKNAVKENPNGIIVCERSVLTDKNVFAQMLYDDGKIESVNYQIYLKWFDEFIEDIPIHGFVYLQVTPEICFERIIQRNRQGETIPLEYLQTCMKYHDAWLDGEKNKLIITNDELHSSLQQIQKWINSCDKFHDRDIRVNDDFRLHINNVTGGSLNIYTSNIKTTNEKIEQLSQRLENKVSDLERCAHIQNHKFETMQGSLDRVDATAQDAISMAKNAFQDNAEISHKLDAFNEIFASDKNLNLKPESSDDDIPNNSIYIHEEMCSKPQNVVISEIPVAELQ